MEIIPVDSMIDFRNIINLSLINFCEAYMVKKPVLED